MSDSVKLSNLSANYGSLAQSMVGESEIVSLENNELKVFFDTKGARISEAVLKNHFKITEDSVHNQSKAPLSLLEDEKNR